MSIILIKVQYLCTKVAKLFIDLFFWTSYLSKISTCKRFNIMIYIAGFTALESTFTKLKAIYSAENYLSPKEKY